MMKNRYSFFLILLIGITMTSTAEVKLNSLFSNYAVLQQGMEVPVWGTAGDGEKVTVIFAGQQVETTAVNGRWMLKLKPMKASLIPQNMTIKGSSTIVLNDLLVGEVWFCSGQSNMAFPLRAVLPVGNAEPLSQVISDAQNFPMIRQFSIPLKKSENIPGIIDDVNGKWVVCDSKSAGNFSAVGFFMARELQRKLNVPIGIINSSYGGTAIENWMSHETLNSNPAWASIMTNFEKNLKEFGPKLKGYQMNETSLFEQYRIDSALAVQQKKPLPRKPSPPMSPAERGGPTGLWNTMVYPVIPYAMKGVAWYQGEANASRGLQYRTLLPALINNWRSAWKQGDFPFLIVQIPGWKNHFPELKEAQLLASQTVAKTALTVTYDCDDTLDVHPGNKQPVGERLALAARAIAYGENIVYSGPEYQSMKVEGNKVVLSFKHIGAGLVALDGELRDFVIAGSDKVFVPAKAQIIKDKVIVWAEEVDNPVAVRAGWRLCPQMNLYNKEGLPASPFRTDVQ